MSTKPNVLIILTSHAQLGSTGKPSGWFLPEFAHPYHVLAPVANLTVASPLGGEAPLDPSSIEFSASDAASQDFLSTKSELWKNTVTISSLLGQTSKFAAVFVVGGHGPMFDLATDSDSIALLAEFADAGKVVSAVCHGPAALVNVKTKDGEWLVAGAEVTAFSDAEEEIMGLVEAMPFALEGRLRERGGVFVKADEPWGVKVAVAKGGLLITGENPASATGTAEAVKKALGL